MEFALAECSQVIVLTEHPQRILAAGQAKHALSMRIVRLGIAASSRAGFTESVYVRVGV